MSFSLLKMFDKTPSYIHHEEENAVTQVSKALLSHLPNSLNGPIVLVCIGTDRSTGDSFGPLVGSHASESKLQYFHVYGTLENPVHALNLEDTIILINQTYQNPYIIGIDACLGKVANIGSITVANGPVRPGAAVNKKLPPIGNIHITGIVNVSGFMEYFVLQNTRLHLVMKMATIVSKSIKYVDYQLKFHVKQ